jgi:DHA1 family tetracycline resistance protein-like MFS transporter
MQPSVITLLVSSYFMAVFFAGPYLGQLSDQRGRVPILVISQLGSAGSFFLMAAAGAPWMLFAARILDGVTGGNIIVAQAYITDVTPREKRTEALGYILAIFGLGFIIGPALGGVLSAWLGPRIPFVIAGLAAFVTAIMSRLLLDETVDRESAPQKTAPKVSLSPLEVAEKPALLLILSVAFIGQFGLGLLQSTFALYGDAVLFAGASDQMTNLGIGLLLAVVGVGQFATQFWLIRPMKHRFGDALLVILGLLIRSAGLILYVAILSPWLAGVASLFFAVGMGLMMPPLQSLATRTVSESIRGAVLGVFTSATSLAIIISTAIAGLIFTIRPDFPFWIGAGLSFVAILPALIVLRKANQDQLQEVPGPAD